MKIQIFAISALLMCSAALQAQVTGGVPTAQGKGDYHLGFRIAPRISTLGAGLELAKGLTPRFGLRGGFNYFSYGYDATESGNSYNLDLELKSFGLFADWHPFKGAFRLTGGFLINGNGLQGKAKLAAGEKFEVDGTEYSLDGNTASLDLSYRNFAPYLGLGWDTTYGDDDHWGIALDFGVLFSGSPELEINAKVDSTRHPGATNTFNSKLKKERESLQGDMDDFKLWPVASLGIVYQF